MSLLIRVELNTRIHHEGHLTPSGGNRMEFIKIRYEPIIISDNASDQRL